MSKQRLRYMSFVKRSIGLLTLSASMLRKRNEPHVVGREGSNQSLRDGYQ
jgi:hypothetical protein